MASKKPENMSFEDSLAELSKLVQEMEQGELSLEQSLKHFERGVNLSAASLTKLDEAEQKVQMLMGQGEQAKMIDFSQGEE